MSNSDPLVVTGQVSDAQPDTCPVGSSAFVTLRGGVTFPIGVIELFLALEDRGLVCEVTRTQRLLVRPATLLTEADADAIRHHKHALIALVRYTDQVNAAYAIAHAPTAREGRKVQSHATHR